MFACLTAFRKVGIRRSVGYFFRDCHRQPLYCFHFYFWYVTLYIYIYIYNIIYIYIYIYIYIEGEGKKRELHGTLEKKHRR